MKFPNNTPDPKLVELHLSRHMKHLLPSLTSFLIIVVLASLLDILKTSTHCTRMALSGCENGSIWVSCQILVIFPGALLMALPEVVIYRLVADMMRWQQSYKGRKKRISELRVPQTFGFSTPNHSPDPSSLSAFDQAHQARTKKDIPYPNWAIVQDPLGHTLSSVSCMLRQNVLTADGKVVVGY